MDRSSLTLCYALIKALCYCTFVRLPQAPPACLWFFARGGAGYLATYYAFFGRKRKHKDFSLTVNLARGSGEKKD